MNKKIKLISRYQRKTSKSISKEEGKEGKIQLIEINKFQNLHKIKITSKKVSFIFLLYIFIILNFLQNSSIETKIVISDNEIKLKIKGDGKQQILNTKIQKPSGILLNNEFQSDSDYYVNIIEGEVNEIKITWDSPLDSCNSMFLGLSNITEVDLSKFDASQVINMTKMFFNCSSLTSINLNISNASSVTYLDNMFFRCVSLKEIDLSHFDSKSVKNMYQMFFDCNSLISINLNNFDTSSVTNFRETFFGLYEIKSLDLSNFNTISALDMSNMFTNCYDLEYLDIRSFNTKNVITMKEMFHHCKQLKSINLVGFSTSKVTNMYGIFYDCESLEYLDLSNFDTSKTTDMQQMFCKCLALKSLNLSSFDTSKVINMNKAFYGCSSLEYLDISSFNTSKVVNMDEMFYNCKTLKSLDLSHFDTSKVQTMNEMFYDCNSLTSLELGNFDTSSVTSMKEMFCNCSSLLSLNLYSFNTTKIQNYINMFNNLSKSLLYCINNDNNISNSIKSKISIYNEVNCSELCSNISNSKFIIEKNKCIIDCSMDDSYFLEYDDICYKSCPKGTYEYYNNTCKKELICQNYYNYEHKGCLDNIPLGFYLNDTINKTIDKCNIKCSNCTMDSVKNGLCITCNNNESYYSKFNDNLNINSFINCYNQNQTGYYLDIINKIFYPCHNTCKECRGSQKNQCIECFDNYTFENGNCYEIIETDSNSENIKNIETTDISSLSEINLNSIIKNELKQDTISIYETNSEKTINEIKSGSTIFSENHSDTIMFNNDELSNVIFSSKINPSTTNYNHENIETNINVIITNKTEFNNENTYNLEIFSEELNKRKYSYEIGSNLTELYDIYKSRTFIDFSQELIEYIYKIFNLDKEEDKIHILIEESISTDSRYATTDYNFRIFLGNGTELNLSLVEEHIYADVYVPIENKDLANYNYSIYFQEQGYDIYNKNSNFYNDFCTSAYYNGNDITIEDRIKYIYPNISLCKNNCIYKKVDTKDERIICFCDINIKTKMKTEQDDLIYEDDENFINYLLDNINYKIFTCIQLIKSFDNLKNNYAFYTIIGLFLVVVILNFVFFFNSLFQMKKKMFVKAPDPAEVKKEELKELNKFMNMENNTPLNPLKKSNKKKTDINIKKPKRKRSKTHKTSKNKRPLIININNFNKINIKRDISNNNFSFDKILMNEKKEILNTEKDKDEELNDLPYALALNQDKRNLFQIFCSLIIQKSELIHLFYGNTKIKLMLINEYILSLLINFFFNSLLYSDEVVSNKYHNNGKLDMIVTLLLSMSSNIITSIICYYVNFSKGIDERYELILEIKDKYHYLRNIIKFFRILKIKLILFFLSEILIFFGCFYYIVIFFIIYSKSRGSLVINYLTSLLEKLEARFILIIIIITTRKAGLVFMNKDLYNISKFINNKF